MHARANEQVNSTCIWYSPLLPTLATLGKSSCIVHDVFHPCAAYTVNDKGGRIHLSDRVG
jgi:hypothetical protein